MPIPHQFVDPYYGAIIDQVVAYMRVGEGTPAEYEARELNEELATEAAAANLASRTAIRPQFLIRVVNGIATGNDNDYTASTENLTVEVYCCVSIPSMNDSVPLQSRAAMGAVGFARRQLAGKLVSGGDQTNEARLAYVGWEQVTNANGLGVFLATFAVNEITTSLDIDA